MHKVVQCKSVWWMWYYIQLGRRASRPGRSLRGIFSWMHPPRILRININSFKGVVNLFRTQPLHRQSANWENLREDLVKWPKLGEGASSECSCTTASQWDKSVHKGRPQGTGIITSESKTYFTSSFLPLHNVESTCISFILVCNSQSWYQHSPTISIFKALEHLFEHIHYT